jgi:hypothetical protein
MPRELTPLIAADLSTFAKSLRARLSERIDGGEQYRKIAARPDDQTAALLRAVRQRGTSARR